MSNPLKKWFARNWTAKLAALALATAIWYLINLLLEEGGDVYSPVSFPASNR